LVGLALVVSTDGGIPLLSHAYAGNHPDVTQFADVLSELVTRWGVLANDSDQLTLVYDAGQDSEANQSGVAASPLHFVGSLPPSQHLDLLAIPRRRYQVVDAERFGGLTATETKTTALGAEHRVIVTHSETFHTKQSRGFDQTLAKARRALAALSARLERGKTKKGRSRVLRG
jgi:transposase